MNVVYVVGAGGIGCAVGYALRRSGISVTFVETNSDKINAGRRDGVTIAGFPPLPAEFIAFPEWEPLPGSIAFLCTKTYDNPAVLARLVAGVTLVPVQNGFDPLLDSVGHEFEGIASFVSECESDRPVTRITRPGELHIGRRTNRLSGDDPLDGLGRLMQTAGLFPVRIVGPIEPFKYTKLMYNAAISPLAAAAGVDNGALLSDPIARRLFFALILENYGILSAAGIELGRIGPFRPATVVNILRRKWLARAMARFFEPSLRGTYCSMAGEIQKGRTEIDNYNGHLIRLAGERVACPLNRAVYNLVKQMEKDRSESRREVLKLLPA